MVSLAVYEGVDLRQKRPTWAWVISHPRRESRATFFRDAELDLAVRRTDARVKEAGRCLLSHRMIDGSRKTGRENRVFSDPAQLAISVEICDEVKGSEGILAENSGGEGMSYLGARTQLLSSSATCRSITAKVHWTPPFHRCVTLLARTMVETADSSGRRPRETTHNGVHAETQAFIKPRRRREREREREEIAIYSCAGKGARARARGGGGADRHGSRHGVRPEGRVTYRYDCVLLGSHRVFDFT